MEKLVSIIVPIYKVEKYIGRCLDSILSQTYKNIEILLVDDGSPDESGRICDIYAIKDARIKVIHKSNGGLSDARNCGIDAANGDFICFVDSDDSIAPNYIECMLKKALEFDADLVVTNFQYVFENGDVNPYIFDYNDEMINSAKAQEILISGAQSLPMVVAWSKLYSSELFKKLRFKKGLVHEDEEICYKIFHFSNKIILSSEVLYNYLQRGDSIMGEKNIDRDLIMCDIFKSRCDFLINEGYATKLCDQAYYKYADLCFYYLNMIKRSDNVDKEILLKQQKKCVDIFDSVLYKKMSLKYKLKFSLKRLLYITNGIDLYRKIFRK